MACNGVRGIGEHTSQEREPHHYCHQSYLIRTNCFAILAAKLYEDYWWNLDYYNLNWQLS